MVDSCQNEASSIALIPTKVLNRSLGVLSTCVKKSGCEKENMSSPLSFSGVSRYSDQDRGLILRAGGGTATADVAVTDERGLGFMSNPPPAPAAKAAERMKRRRRR